MSPSTYQCPGCGRWSEDEASLRAHVAGSHPTITLPEGQLPTGPVRFWYAPANPSATRAQPSDGHVWAALSDLPGSFACSRCGTMLRSSGNPRCVGRVGLLECT